MRSRRGEISMNRQAILQQKCVRGFKPGQIQTNLQTKAQTNIKKPPFSGLNCKQEVEGSILGFYSL